MAGLVSGCLGPAPEDTEYHAFFPCGTGGEMLFGNLEGTGTLVLGRQGSRTSERVPGTGS